MMLDKHEIISRLTLTDWQRLIPTLKPCAGNKAQGLCPFHDDHHPSLSVDLETRRYTCFVCGEKGDIIELYKKVNRTDFKTAIEALGSWTGVIGGAGKEKAGAGKITKVYTYTDESGSLLFEVVRLEPKSFRQRRPDGKGGYIPNIADTRRVLYNLPALSEAQAVFVVEGEKDADNLNRMGLVATTSPMGAGKWQPEYSDALTGKDVIILPDNDEPGKNHAQRIAASLQCKAGSIKVIELPGLPEKGDVSDWLAQGGTKEALMAMTEDAPELGPTENITPPIEAEEEWPKPIPLDGTAALPKFPVEMLPEIGREIVSAVSTINQVDPGLPAIIYLAVLSTCLAKKAEIDLISHTEPVNIFTLSVLDSGERKSPTLKLMTVPLYEWQKERAEDMRGEISEAANKRQINEARLAKLRKDAAAEENATERVCILEETNRLSREIEESPLPCAPTILADDITPEKVGPLMAENNERLSIISAEGGMFGIMAGRYNDKNGSNIDIFLKGHAGEAFSAHRVGREAVHLEAPALTMCFSVQPVVMREIGANRQFRGRGLTARFLYAVCEPQAGRRTRQTLRLSESVKARYSSHIKALLDMPLSLQALRLSEEAQEAWDAFSNEVEAEMRPGGNLFDFKDWGNKLAGAVARIAGLLHFAEYGPEAGSKPISVDIVDASCTIGGYFIKHALAAFSLMKEDPRIEAAKKILEYLTRHEPNTFKVREVLHYINAFKIKADVMPGITVLLDRGYIRECPKEYGGTGRPEAESYEVNPQIKSPKTIHNNNKTHEPDTSVDFVDEFQGAGKWI